MDGLWVLEMHKRDTDVKYDIKVAFPKNLSVTGLKNLVQEKTDIPSSKLKMSYVDESTTTEKEVCDHSEKLGPLFLRDYPKIKNGSKFFISSEDDGQQ